jgi:hypothetical protein
VANVVVSALATWNGKALKKAQQDVNVFEKRVKSFARTFGVAFSGAALVAFGKKAVKVFAEDEAAAKSLQLQLENTGNAFRVREVENYIQSLEKTYAILTDLRKPFQTFLNLTKSVGLSQRTLEAALNISAGTGESLDTVVNALAAGIRGKTKAIENLNTGIDANIIKTGDMNKIMLALEDRFKGQAAARLDTYTGKMDVLKKGADEATKSIGRGLVDALTILSKDQSVSNLATDFENLGDNIAYAIREIAKLTKGFTDLVSNPTFKAGLLAIAIASKSPKAVAAAFTIVGGSAVLGAATSARPLSAEENSALAKARILNRRLEERIIKLSTGVRKQEYDILKKKTELDKLKEKFDLELIGLQKARNEATTDEVKSRLDGLIAIAKNDEALGKKALAELDAAEAAQEFAKNFSIALEAVKSMTTKINDFIKSQVTSFDDALESVRLLNARIAAMIAKLATGTTTTTGGGGATYDYALAEVKKKNEEIKAFEYNLGLESVQGLNQDIAQFLARNASTQSPTEIRVTVDANSDRLSQAIAESIQVANRSGYSTVPAGFIV